MQQTAILRNKPDDRTASGWINGFLGVVIFSGSLPATRVAVLQFDALFLTVARATIAGLLAVAVLFLFQQKRPARQDIIPLIIVSLGVVVGFPLLTALALRHVTSAHSIVFVGLLPLATAIFGVIRGGERPRPAFWLFSILGSLFVVGFALTQGVSASVEGDLLMLASIVVCGLGYAEGGRLSRTLGGWQVISWALVLSLPVMAAMSWALAPASFANISAPAWISLGYGALQHVHRLRVLVPGPGPGAASPPSASCSCCSPSSGWRWRRACCTSTSAWPCWASRWA